LSPDFDRCAAWIESALPYCGGRYALEHVRERVASGDMQLFAGERCAVVTEIATWPTGLKVCTVVFGGGDLAELKPLSEFVQAWAKSEGCTQIEIIGRPGWARALGTGRAVATIFRKEL
jgi:hypothetical protein